MAAAATLEYAARYWLSTHPHPSPTPADTFFTLSTACLQRPSAMSVPEPPLPAGEVDPDEISAATFGAHDLHDDDCSSDEGVLSLSPAIAPQSSQPDTNAEDDDALCVVCFERPPETTLEPCGHANLCLTCLSRLAKRRCPTCRARAKKVRLVLDGEPVTRAVRDVIAERKRNELEVLGSTLQIVFLGPPAVGKKTLVRKLIARFPLHPPSTHSRADDSEHSSSPSVPDNTDDTDDSDQQSSLKPLLQDEDIFSDGTDFSGNARIAGTIVRLTVLRRTSLSSRRMMLDDVRVLKPDVLVLCCSAHSPTTFDEMLAWDRALRSGFARSRVWALLAIEEGDFSADAASFHLRQTIPATISAMSPPELRPRGHYLCTHGTAFNIGFKQLAKDVVSIARMARDEQFANELAAEEARHLAVQHAAGTLADQSEAASLVIANNGIPLPHFATIHVGAPHSSRSQTASGRPSESTRAPFGIRGIRSRDSNHNSGISFAGIVNWFSGASSDTQ